MDEKIFCVYIMSNQNNKVLYTGVTSNLPKRVYEHKQHLVDGFTTRYQVDKLVYYAVCPNAEAAIAREKEIKAGSRLKKVMMIECQNPTWNDLYSTIL